MKKVIFISAIALAAAASCTKSEVVDTKFNEQIGFETYLGRDAQTKASVATAIETAGIYGFYTGNDQWKSTSAANLWANDPLTAAGTVTPTKYWTNATDWYSFVAYAPKDGTGITVPTKAEGADYITNPAITFAVQPDLANQVDFLYAKTLDVHKPAENGTVPMIFKHALARLTVNAKSAENQTFAFRVKKVSINGGFITSDVLTLATGLWTAAGTPVAPTTPGTEATETTPATLPVYATTYTFYNNADNTTALGTTNTEYAKVGENYSNYLMMVPVNFTQQAAYLTVEYTTYYANQESTVNTVTFPVTTNFEQGKAYAINLVFSKETQEIKFSVSVEDWQPTATTGEGDDATTSTDEIDNDQNIAA